jgi:hypothetical protein
MAEPQNFGSLMVEHFALALQHAFTSLGVPLEQAVPAQAVLAAALLKTMPVLLVSQKFAATSSMVEHVAGGGDGGGGDGGGGDGGGGDGGGGDGGGGEGGGGDGGGGDGGGGLGGGGDGGGGLGGGGDGGGVGGERGGAWPTHS